MHFGQAAAFFPRTGLRERVADEECSRTLPVSLVVADCSLSPSGFLLVIPVCTTTSQSAVSCCGFYSFSSHVRYDVAETHSSNTKSRVTLLHGAFGRIVISSVAGRIIPPWWTIRTPTTRVSRVTASNTYSTEPELDPSRSNVGRLAV